MRLRNQLIVGRGSPVAMQSRTAVPPSLAAVVGLGTNISGTTGEEGETEKLETLHE